jgi:hypothetical protein
MGFEDAVNDAVFDVTEPELTVLLSTVPFVSAPTRALTKYEPTPAGRFGRVHVMVR